MRRCHWLRDCACFFACNSDRIVIILEATTVTMRKFQAIPTSCCYRRKNSEARGAIDTFATTFNVQK
jgi:hypothetical protein